MKRELIQKPMSTTTKHIDKKVISQTAKTLVERHGDNAVKIAQERADTASFGGFPSEKDVALAVLTKVEDLLNSQTN